MIPCTNVIDDFSYSKALIGDIMQTLPRFVHKHTVVYKMYTTLKLYYLHQQELLNEVLQILKLHIHSLDLAKTLTAYIATMQGGNYGWVKSITTLLRANMKIDQNAMQGIVSQHRMIFKLHSIIRHANMHSHKMIHRLYKTMTNHGFIHHTGVSFNIQRTHNNFVTNHNEILKKIKHVFKHHVSTSSHTVTHHTHTSTTHTSHSVKKTSAHKKTKRVKKSHKKKK